MPILRSDAIQNWWPTTQSLDLVQGSIQSVAAALQAEVGRYLGDEPIDTSWKTFPDIDAAFRSAPDFTNVPTVYLVLPTHSKWSVLWNNSFLCNGYDALCSGLTKNHGLTTIHWSSHDQWSSFQTGSAFTHRRLVGESVKRRSVQVAQQDKGWHFFENGEPLPEEALETYTVRRKRDRLNEKVMSDFLSRMDASPWLEEFCALATTPTFILRRENPPPTVTRRPISEVLNS